VDGEQLPHRAAFGPGVATTPARDGGNLTARTLPTLGRLEWAWQKIYFPTARHEESMQTTPGVTTRTMLNPRQHRGKGKGPGPTPIRPLFRRISSARAHTTSSIPHRPQTVNYCSVALDPELHRLEATNEYACRSRATIR